MVPHHVKRLMTTDGSILYLEATDLDMTTDGSTLYQETTDLDMTTDGTTSCQVTTDLDMTTDGTTSCQVTTDLDMTTDGSTLYQETTDLDMMTDGSTSCQVTTDLDMKLTLTNQVLEGDEFGETSLIILSTRGSGEEIALQEGSTIIVSTESQEETTSPGDNQTDTPEESREETIT
uniref:Uncharacterized protein n=1 Tax=Timema poppense TaxID=170557 RepID=A0A7R9H2T3_TIMPO|nr:unnamed protein product [Timema poppensis]